jgi:hypothetical protein
MSDLNFSLLPWQQIVFSDPTRFKVIAAGRRCGKSRLAAVTLLIEALRCPSGSAVMYVAPTNGQARQIIWDVLMELGREVIQSSHINNQNITTINGATIYVRGADRPDTLRGVSLTYAVLDEVADIKPEAWEQVIRASLSDKKGRAMFIGTPKGRNWFHDMFRLGQGAEDKDWKSWHFTTKDNPLIDPEEIEAAKKTLSTFAFKQEYMASFTNAGSNIFKEEWLRYGEEPEIGSYYVAVDLAGFEEVAKQAANSKKRLDQTAISVVKVTEDGKWFVKEIEYGRWDVRETASKILLKMRDYKPMSVGIEKGALKNAVLPYLTDLMRKNNVYAHIVDLTHGNRKKTDRIIWSLQGRFEHGRIVLNRDENWDEFIDQLLLFPSVGVHDDLCFVSGTMISTPFGKKPIESLKIGDLVDTPTGPKKVIDAKLTNPNAQVYALSAGLVGTGSHPVMTNNGWKDLCKIEKDDILVYQHKGESSWVSQLKKAWFVSRFTSMDTSTTAIQKQSEKRIGAISPSLVGVGYSTAMFGSSTMGQSQKDTKFTTKMGTSLTTTFQTLLASVPKSTDKSTWKGFWKKPEVQNGLSTLPKSEKKPQNGINLKLERLGTSNMAQNLGKTASQLSTLVKSVAQSLNPSRLLAFTTVLVGARLLLGEKATQTITPLKARHPVYNLTVEDAKCYYANGILVHNCDSLSYIDQLAVTSYFVDDQEDDWEPVDVISGV